MVALLSDPGRLLVITCGHHSEQVKGDVHKPCLARVTKRNPLLAGTFSIEMLSAQERCALALRKAGLASEPIAPLLPSG